MNVIDKAIKVARADGAANATFGFLRHAFSLSQTAVGGSTDLTVPQISQIPFELTKRKSDVTNLVDSLLAESDGFIITHFRFGLIQVVSGAVPHNCRTHYFVNPNVFDSTQAPGLRQIYNGKLFIQSAQTVLNTGGWPMSALQRATSFNEGLQIVADTTDVSLPVSAYPEGLYGAMPVNPLLKIGGRNKTTVTVQLPEAVSCVSGTATTETVAVLDTYGVIVPGAAQVYDGQFLID
jgi:hypothetical protein